MRGVTEEPALKVRVLDIREYTSKGGKLYREMIPNGLHQNIRVCTEVLFRGPDISTLLSFIIRGCIWDILILIFDCHVLVVRPFRRWGFEFEARLNVGKWTAQSNFQPRSNRQLFLAPEPQTPLP